MCPAKNACATCYQNCFLIHRKKHDDSSTAFFKIMFGKKFDELLVVPPAFSKKLKSLVGRKITLEDSSRRKWDVLLANMKGSLAFKKGWHNFVLDHGIDMGDLVVFYYFRDSHFLVEIFGTSGCQRTFTFERTNKNRSNEVTRSSIPLKRPSDSSYEQSAQKRHFSSSAFSGPNIDVTPRPKNVRALKEPSVMARKIPIRGHIRERSPSVVPVADTLVEPCSMTSRDKNKPKIVPMAETVVEPCFMASRDTNKPKVAPTETLVEPCFVTSQDKNRPEVVPVAETLVEPCFITSRDKNAASEYDRDCLFDLSAFEMPGKKSTIDREEETDYLLDLSAYDLAKTEIDADRTDELHMQGNISSQVSATFQNASTGMADNKTTIDRDDVRDYLLDMSVFEIPENEYTNVCDKGHLQENLHCQESDKIQNAETEDTSVDLLNREISERAIQEVLSESREVELRRHECTPLSSSLPNVDLPIDSNIPLKIIGKHETSGFSSLSGRKMRLNSQETRVCNQEFVGNAEGESSLNASFSISEQNYGDLGGNMRCTQQESREVKQDICGDAMVDGSFGGISPINEKTEISCRKFTDNFNPMVKIEADVNTIVKLEPMDCDTPSETAVKVTCSVPPGIEDFLELREPLQVAVQVGRRHIKPKQRLVFLRDPAGRLWPVVYHHKNNFKVLTSGWKKFMKVNDIQPGDECTFTVENSEENSFTVQVVRHN